MPQSQTYHQFCLWIFSSVENVFREIIKRNIGKALLLLILSCHPTNLQFLMLTSSPYLPLSNHSCWKTHSCCKFSSVLSMEGVMTGYLPFNKNKVTVCSCFSLLCNSVQVQLKCGRANPHSKYLSILCYVGNRFSTQIHPPVYCNDAPVCLCPIELHEECILQNAMYSSCVNMSLTLPF
jgi:hypothetical protein